jgi:TRAP-type mannitol/chloroaromatic compound transport system permease small subunit
MMHNQFVRRLESINEYTGRMLAWLTLTMVIVTFVVVVLRYAFDLGWIALQESVNYMHAAVFMLGTAYAFKHGAHVRVDIFYNRLGSYGKAWIDIIGNLLFMMPVCIFIFWASIDYVQISWHIKEASGETGGLAYAYLLKTVIPFMACLLFLQAVADTVKQFLVLSGSSKPVTKVNT